MIGRKQTVSSQQTWRFWHWQQLFEPFLLFRTLYFTQPIKCFNRPPALWIDDSRYCRWYSIGWRVSTLFRRNQWPRWRCLFVIAAFGCSLECSSWKPFQITPHWIKQSFPPIFFHPNPRTLPHSPWCSISTRHWCIAWWNRLQNTTKSFLYARDRTASVDRLQRRKSRCFRSFSAVSHRIPSRSLEIIRDRRVHGFTKLVVNEIIPWNLVMQMLCWISSIRTTQSSMGFDWIEWLR